MCAMSGCAPSCRCARRVDGIVHVQGTPFAELSFEDYAHTIAAYTRTNFLTTVCL